jgi:uncharacterized protein (TIGR02996 family)
MMTEGMIARDDPLGRLAYADFLEERGRDEEAAGQRALAVCRWCRVPALRVDGCGACIWDKLTRKTPCLCGRAPACCTAKRGSIVQGAGPAPATAEHAYEAVCEACLEEEEPGPGDGPCHWDAAAY